jgi:hypothetical protein
MGEHGVIHDNGDVFGEVTARQSGVAWRFSWLSFVAT